MRTVHFPSSGGVSVQPRWMQTPSRQIPPGCRPSPSRQTPAPDADPLDADPPWILVTWPVMHARKPTPLPYVNIMTDTCINITLSQTSFAGGKNVRTERFPYLSYDLWTLNFAFIPYPAHRLLSTGNVSVTISYSLESTTSHPRNGPAAPLRHYFH